MNLVNPKFYLYKILEKKYYMLTLFKFKLYKILEKIG